MLVTNGTLHVGDYFVCGMFDGRVAPLVAHFSERRKLSKKDLADLRKLLQELDDEQ